MSLEAQSKIASPRALPELHQVDWSPNDPVPAGISVENLRRRGIDLLRIQVDASRGAGFFGKLFGTGKRGDRKITITIVDEQMRFDNIEHKSARTGALIIPFNDINAIQVGTSGLGGKMVLRITFRDTTLDIGAGMPEAALHWLRERLLLEKAGLVWKPLYNVGKRTTRKTCNPDDDAYANWPTGPNRLVSFFLQEAPERARILVDEIKNKNWNNANVQAHWLKSSSAVVGASYLSELCQRMEIDLQTNDFSRIDVLAPHFTKEFNKVIELLSRISNTAPVAAPVTIDVPEPEHAEAEPILKGYRILLAEDSKVNQEMARDCLDGTGCELVIGSNGQLAIELHEKERFDAILMDCQMPGLNGFEATKIIRSMEMMKLQSRTPIIALTANALRDDRDVCIAAGMDDYVSKPYMPHEIIDVLLKWLPERAAVDQQIEALKDTGAEMQEALSADVAAETLPDDGGTVDDAQPEAVNS